MGSDNTFGFGLAREKREGSPIHPDELDVPEDTPRDTYDAWYARQLAAYEDYWNKKNDL